MDGPPTNSIDCQNSASALPWFGFQSSLNVRGCIISADLGGLGELGLYGIASFLLSANLSSGSSSYATSSVGDNVSASAGCVVEEPCVSTAACIEGSGSLNPSFLTGFL